MRKWCRAELGKTAALHAHANCFCPPSHMLGLAALLLPLTAIQHSNEMCHAACFGSRTAVLSGHCRSGFCGDGACCKQGLKMPPCDGAMGCDGFQCCTDLADTGSSVDDEVTGTTLPPPPPLPPLSECAILRIEYEIGKQRHDELGDKEYEVIVRVEPWRPASLVKLVYHQTGLEDGASRPIEVARLTGGSVERDTREEQGDLQVRTLLLKLSDGRDAELTSCRFGDVSIGAVGHVMAAVGLGSLEHSAREQDGVDDERTSSEQRAQAAAAHQCHSGTLRFWSHGSPHKDIRRIGCHLPYDPPPPLPPGRPPPPTPHPPPQKPWPPAVPPRPPKIPQYMFFAAPPPPPGLAALQANFSLMLTLRVGVVGIGLLLVLLACTQGLGCTDVRRARCIAAKAGGNRLGCVQRAAVWMLARAASVKPGGSTSLGRHAPLSSVEDGPVDDDDEEDDGSYVSTSLPAARANRTVSLSNEMDDDDDADDRGRLSTRTRGARAAMPKLAAAAKAAAAATTVVLANEGIAEAPTAEPRVPLDAADPFSLQLYGKPKGTASIPPAPQPSPKPAGPASGTVPALPRPPSTAPHQAAPGASVAATPQPTKASAAGERGSGSGDEDWEAQASLGRWHPGVRVAAARSAAPLPLSASTDVADPWELVCPPTSSNTSSTPPAPPPPAAVAPLSALDDLADEGPAPARRPAATRMSMDG